MTDPLGAIMMVPEAIGAKDAQARYATFSDGFALGDGPHAAPDLY